MRRLIDSFAEYERLIIAARTRSALAAKRRRGQRISGAIPYGYRLGTDRRTLEPAGDEQQTIRLIHERRAAGCTLQGIADELNERGSRTRAGSLWRHQYVRSVLQRGDEVAA